MQVAHLVRVHCDEIRRIIWLCIIELLMVRYRLNPEPPGL